jgi:hypothetical protein
MIRGSKNLLLRPHRSDPAAICGAAAKAGFRRVMGSSQSRIVQPNSGLIGPLPFGLLPFIGPLPFDPRIGPLAFDLPGPRFLAFVLVIREV